MNLTQQHKFITRKDISSFILFLALLFTTSSLLTFANTSELVKPFGSIMITTSCGEVGYVLTNANDTTEDILEMAQELEDWLCD